MANNACNDDINVQVIDLRAADDSHIVGSGKKILGDNPGILLEIETDGMSEDILCNIFVLSDGLINISEKTFRFSELMEALDAVKDAKEMKKELEENDLLRKDIKNLVSYVTPYIPLIGILSGGITVGKHVISTKASCSEKEE
ncbi:Hypothetical predicted protein [Paramuricea clavata]|uniref:Uncharacterized protein n=1 Tax=Paramuricea clavata TaxID=317549 RepID=A0A6S7I6D9_PARCT|nr:Hypothetical predicted protein [Paramuricea clavata]